MSTRKNQIRAPAPDTKKFLAPAWVQPGCRSIQIQIYIYKSRSRKVTKTKRFLCEKCAGAATLCIDSKKSLMILARTRKAVLQYCSSGPQPANLCNPKIKTLQQLQPSKKKHHLSHSLVICELHPMDFETLAGATCGLAVPACLISQMMSNRTYGNVQLKYVWMWCREHKDASNVKRNPDPAGNSTATSRTPGFGCNISGVAMLLAPPVAQDLFDRKTKKQHKNNQQTIFVHQYISIKCCQQNEKCWQTKLFKMCFNALFLVFAFPSHLNNHIFSILFLGVRPGMPSKLLKPPPPMKAFGQNWRYWCLFSDNAQTTNLDFSLDTKWNISTPLPSSWWNHCHTFQ